MPSAEAPSRGSRRSEADRSRNGSGQCNNSPRLKKNIRSVFFNQFALTEKRCYWFHSYCINRTPRIMYIRTLTIARDFLTLKLKNYNFIVI